jgi:hypothetical protein
LEERRKLKCNNGGGLPTRRYNIQTPEASAASGVFFFMAKFRWD